MIGINTEIVGDREMRSAFVKLGSVFSNLSPIFEKLGPEFFRQTRERFHQQGPGWPALSKEYAARKAQIYGSKTILRATDRLYESFKTKGVDSIERVGPLEAEFGSSVPYGVFHDSVEARSSSLPRRQIVDVTVENLADYKRVAEESLDEQIGKLGFHVI